MISVESPGERAARPLDVDRSSRLPSRTGRARPYEIGRTFEGRPIEAVLRGPEDGALRILVMAGQHGDEPWGKIAVRQWIAVDREPEREEDRSASVSCLAILDANPDGARLGRRTNAQGIDRMREHQQLRTPEVRTVHETVRRFRPHLIVDVHNYPARRRFLLAQGWTIGPDIQLSGPTHPAIRTAMTSADFDGLFLRVRADLESAGHSVSPYTLFRRSGRARPSTLRVRDARNSLALRHGVPTVLLEGRDPGRGGEPDEPLRTVAAQRVALGSIESWAREHRDRLLRGPPVPEVGEAIPTDARWEEGGRPQPVALRRPGSMDVVTIEWARFAGTVSIRSEIRLPRAYAVRSDLLELRSILERHDITGDPVERPCAALVEPVGADRTGSGEPGAPSAPPGPFVLDLAGYVGYSVHQRAGRALAVWLESGAKFGLAPLLALGEGAGSDGRPSVVRIVQWEYPPLRARSGFLGGSDRPFQAVGVLGSRRFPWSFPKPEEAYGSLGRHDPVNRCPRTLPTTDPVDAVARRPAEGWIEAAGPGPGPRGGSSPSLDSLGRAPTVNYAAHPARWIARQGNPW